MRYKNCNRAAQFVPLLRIDHRARTKNEYCYFVEVWAWVRDSITA